MKVNLCVRGGISHSCLVCMPQGEENGICRGFVIIGEHVEAVVNDSFHLFVVGMKCKGKRISFSGSLVINWD